MADRGKPAPMKVGANTMSFMWKTSAPEALETLAREGYRCFELMAQRPHFDPFMERSEALGGSADRWMHENPLAVGVAAFALGAIAGLSMPVTETEHRTLGPARERLMHEASRVMENAIGK